MHLRSGGIDIYYIDESHDGRIYLVTAVCVPFLRFVENRWVFVWNNHYQGAKDWRKKLKEKHGVPTAKELHGVNFASGRGHYNRGRFNFDRPKACAIYRDILSTIDFLPGASVMSVAAYGGRFLYGSKRLEASMHGLFQRMRKKCEASDTNAMAFFDQGHPEYRRLYRQAQIYLPTGSRFGGWGGGASRNLPLNMFVEDANEKNSKHCHFTQVADMIAYSAFLKLRSEEGTLEEWQNRCSVQNIYDSLPGVVRNDRASLANPRDAIVRMK